MANRVSVADLDSALPSDGPESLFDLDPTGVFSSSPFAPPPAPPYPPPQLQPQPRPQPQPAPPNFNPDLANLRRYSGQHLTLPPLPDLLTQRRQFPDTTEPLQLDSLPPYHRLFGEVRQSPPASNSNNHGHSHGTEGSSWLSASLDFSSTSPDANSRRPESHHYAVCFEFPTTPHTQHTVPSAPSSHSIPTQPLQPSRLPQEPNSDDYYLAAIADGDFSSPSLPPANSSPLPPIRPQPLNLPRPLEIGGRVPITGPSRQRASKTGVVDLTKEEPDLESSGVDPTTPAMPISRKRNAAAAGLGGSATPLVKRRQSGSSPSTSGRAAKSRRKQTVKSEEIPSPFGDDDLVCQNGPDTIDLSNATEVPKELMAAKVDNRMKLGKFQCVICIDDAAALTVTHCGHLFCSECLHSALHIDGVKKSCPVCRTKVDTKDKKGKNLKSYYHLELKIMTANKKGKRPAGHP